MKKKWISNTISLKYHNWDLIEDICQHLFRQWLCAEQATGHCPNQWWLTRLAPICVAWMKSFEFLIWFHWNMFIGVYWKYVSIGPDDCLMTNGQQAIIWASDSLIYWRIYASFQLRHFLFQIKISKKCVHLGIVENMLILEQIMAWHQSGDMALFEPMMAEFTDPYASFDWKLMDFKQNVI